MAGLAGRELPPRAGRLTEVGAAGLLHDLELPVSALLARMERSGIAADRAHLERMEQRHRHDRSHWYLFILGTEQAAQGQGLGSALLAHMLARVDAAGLPAYLESSSERNLALYGRHGFAVTSEVAIPGGPRIWPMRREPRR